MSSTRIIDSLFRFIGAALLLTLTFACENSSIKVLKNSRQFQIYMPTATDSSKATMPQSFDGPYYTVKDLEKFDVEPEIWINYPIDPIAYSHPTLLLKRCFNLASIGISSGIIYQADVNPDSTFNFANFKKPFVSLPNSLESHIALHIKRSPKTGLAPDCSNIYLGNETSLIRQFSLSSAPDIMIGFLLVLLGLIYIASWPVHRNCRILYVGLFHVSLALVFSLGHQIYYFTNSNGKELFTAFTVGLLTAPIAGIMLIDQLFARKYKALPVLAIINIVFAVLCLTLLFLGYHKYHQALRNLYFAFSLVEFASFLPLFIAHVLHSPNGSFRLTYLGFITFILCIFADVFGSLFMRSIFHASAFGGFLYLLGGLTNYARNQFLNSNNESKKHLNDAEEFTIRLAAEVKLREDRLRERNRLFEESNIELEEKNILLRMAFKRLDDLLNQQSAMLKKASKIKATVLPELIESRESSRQHCDRDKLRQISVIVHKLASALDPFARLHDNIIAINNKMVWILINNKEVETNYKNALNSSKLDIRCFDTASGVLESLKLTKPNLLIICSTHTTLITDLFRLYPEVQIILSGESDFKTSIDILRNSEKLNHLIFQHSDSTFFSQRNLLVTTTKILSNDIFGIEKYLDWGVDIKEIIISGNNSRSSALTQLNLDLERAGITSAMTHRAHHLADELLMNAIYDAPVDPLTKRSRYNHLTRSVTVELDPSEYARLRYGYDGTILAISIDDPFGGLKREIILKYLKACLEGLFGTINETEGKGGGGMGLFQIMKAADLLVTNIKAGKKTEIIALLNVHEKSTLKGQCFHYFVDHEDL